MNKMRLKWLVTSVAFAGATLCAPVNAQMAPPRQSYMRKVPKREVQKAANASNEKTPLSKALIPPAVIASVGITGFLVSGIIYEYTTDLFDQVRSCYGATCPEDKALQARARAIVQGTTGGMVASGLVFGVGLIWFAILAPNANTYTPPQGAYVVPVITPNGFFLTGAF